MKKNVNKSRQKFFYLLFLILNFFITIGDLVKFIFFLPVKLIYFAVKIVSKLFIFIVKKIDELFLRLKNRLFFKKTNLSKIYQWRVSSFRFYILFIRLIKEIPNGILFVVNKLRLFLIFILKSFFNFIVEVIKTIVSSLIIFINSLSIKIRYFFLGFIICLILVAINQIYIFVKSLPSPNDIGKVNYSLSTHILDRNGKLLYEIYREQNRTPVKLKELPPFVYQATIAIEDKDFYRHKGISLLGGIFRAIKDMFLTKKLQGGSTITQQLVKSALLSPDRTIERKLKEIILALWTERIFSKDEILEMYLNQVPYGGSSYGVEEAAKTYFGKHAKELVLEEAALLAGLPQAPSLYSPHINPDLSMERRNDVLKKMKEQGYIDENSKLKAQNSKLSITSLSTLIKAPHFVFYVKSQLEKEFGIKQVEEGGLRVTTTLDLDIQTEAEKILREELDKIKNLNVTNGAILVVRPTTGEIIAMVGSVDYFSLPSGAFNVTTALRQPGSAIKPIMYSLALERAFTPATIIDDSPIAFYIPGTEPYKPVNYDGRFHGRIPLRYALANSYNVPAVKVLQAVGVENFIEHARRMGISTWNDSARYGLSLTLGGGDVTMIDMVKAFSVFANDGYKTDITSYLKIDNSQGKKVFEYNLSKTKVLNEGISFIISDILSDNVARQWAFGPQSYLEIPGYKVAVKTGTTNDKKDNWSIGYTPEFLVVVWVGNNDSSPMNPYLTSGITGAAPIWNKTMSYLLKNYSNGKNWFSKGENIIEKICYFGRTEYFIKGTENKISCRDNLFNLTLTPTKNN